MLLETRYKNLNKLDISAIDLIMENPKDFFRLFIYLLEKSGWELKEKSKQELIKSQSNNLLDSHNNTNITLDGKFKNAKYRIKIHIKIIGVNLVINYIGIGFIGIENKTINLNKSAKTVLNKMVTIINDIANELNSNNSLENIYNKINDKYNDDKIIKIFNNIKKYAVKKGFDITITNNNNLYRINIDILDNKDTLSVFKTIYFTLQFKNLKQIFLQIIKKANMNSLYLLKAFLTQDQLIIELLLNNPDESSTYKSKKQDNNTYTFSKIKDENKININSIIKLLDQGITDQEIYNRYYKEIKKVFREK